MAGGVNNSCRYRQERSNRSYRVGADVVPRQQTDRRLNYLERSFFQIVGGSWHSAVAGGEQALADAPFYRRSEQKKEAGV
jgi:hypothetical protein